MSFALLFNTGMSGCGYDHYLVTLTAVLLNTAQRVIKCHMSKPAGNDSNFFQSNTLHILKW